MKRVTRCWEVVVPDDSVDVVDGAAALEFSCPISSKIDNVDGLLVGIGRQARTVSVCLVSLLLESIVFP